MFCDKAWLEVGFPVKFFHTKLRKPFRNRLRIVHMNIVMLKTGEAFCQTVAIKVILIV